MAPYTVVHGPQGFLGQGTFGVVEKVIDDSTGKVKTTTRLGPVYSPNTDKLCGIGVCMQNYPIPG